MKIISLSGRAGAGKDTIAAHLVSKGYIKASFAASLKDALAAIFGWDRELLEGTTEESRIWRETPDRWLSDKLDLGVDITPRWMMVNFGTNVVRNHFHQDVWLISFERWLDQHKDYNIVITDTRFLNEFECLRKRGAVLLGVYREIPKWLDAFYHLVDNRLRWKGGPGLMEVDLSSPRVQQEVVGHAKEVLRCWRMEIHDSELQLLLWNKYAGIIDNTGKLSESVAQLESLIA